MANRIELDYVVKTSLSPYAITERMVGFFSQSPSGASPIVLSSEHGPCEGQVYISLAWGLDAVGADLCALVVAATDGFVDIAEIQGLQVVNMRLPEAFARPYPGPKFGISGIRDRTHINRRALIGAMVRPGPEMNAAQTAQRVAVLAEAGADIVVEDVVQPDTANCPFDERVKEVTRVIMRHAERTGKQVIYAFDVTGSIDDMRYRHDIVRDEGGTCIQIGLSAVGLAASIAMGRYTQLPLHGLARGWRQVTQNTLGGWQFDAYSALYRLAGIDHLHLGRTGQDGDCAVLDNARSLLNPLFNYKACVPMPVICDGKGGPTPSAILRHLNSSDLIHLLPAEADPVQIGRLGKAWDAAVSGAPPMRVLR
ncbi:MAG: RuBisCO large subunit C-terminal-like domain-containing protein [Pseudoprimorskyibacter sp.]|nr:RuBisCO large subunit C-terminal-like domain-containing protein [Pseudoprimorskyibacter sp.]